MIRITPNIAIDENEVHQAFIRSSGPGGQKVNKTATAVQLRFDMRNSPSVPDDIRERLIVLAGERATTDGVLIIDARRFRTQEQNRQDAVQRLVELVRKAIAKPKTRRLTRPTPVSRKRRLQAKRRRGEIKRIRHPVSRLEE